MAAISLVNPAAEPVNIAQINGLAHQLGQPGSPSGAAQTDTVRLSDVAQARQLRQSGDTIDQIAWSLATTVQHVNDYLGITLQQKLSSTFHPTVETRA